MSALLRCRVAMILPSGKFLVMEPEGAEAWADVRTRNAGADVEPDSSERDPEWDMVRSAKRTGLGGRATIAAVQHYLRRGQPHDASKEHVLKAKCLQRFLASTMTFRIEKLASVISADGDCLVLPPVPRVRVASEVILYFSRMERNLKRKRRKAQTIIALTEKVLAKALDL